MKCNPGHMKINGPVRNSRKAPALVLRAERALRRAAKNVEAQHRLVKLPVIIWPYGKVVEKPA